MNRFVHHVAANSDTEPTLPRFVCGEWTLPLQANENAPNWKNPPVVELEAPDGSLRQVPAFMGSDGHWHCRLSGTVEGRHHFRLLDTADPSGRTNKIIGSFHVDGHFSGNRFLEKGPVHIDAEARLLRHANGEPFFLLADSWWHGMTHRLRFPEDFHYLVNYRKEQGFNAVQFAIDNPCDVGPFDPRAANEAGHGWTPQFAEINPAYWDRVDQRIFHLLEQGLLPMILGSWAYYIGFMGEEKMRHHWRHLIARYGALPVFWILCGEARLPWYENLLRGESGKAQTQAWTRVARDLREHNSYQRPLGLHSGPAIWDIDGSYPPLEDLSLIDVYFGMGGHGAVNEYLDVVEPLKEMAAYRSKHQGIAITGEAAWEGMSGACGPRIQRASFWGSVLTGAPGHCYGCDALWQMNSRDEPFGETAVLNRAWGNTPWEDAHQWPGARHVAVGKAILERFDWVALRPANQRIDPHIMTETGSGLHGACGEIPGQQLLVYFAKTNVRKFTLSGFAPEKSYPARWVSPIDGSEHPLKTALSSSANGEIRPPVPPVNHDWLLVIDLT